MAPPDHEEWEALERLGYVSIDPATRGDLSVLLFTITDAGRRAPCACRAGQAVAVTWIRIAITPAAERLDALAAEARLDIRAFV